jgi:DNA-directed RNA polymerase specialized sigma24 family protein
MSRLEEFEQYIRGKAISYARRPDDIEDFQQVGRLAAWAALKDDPTATKSYVYRRIGWRMNDFWKRGLYKDPDELSADEHFNNVLYGEYTTDDNIHW